VSYPDLFNIYYPSLQILNVSFQIVNHFHMFTVFLLKSQVLISCNLHLIDNNS